VAASRGTTKLIVLSAVFFDVKLLLFLVVPIEKIAAVWTLCIAFRIVFHIKPF
jgi:hypothetical protein